MAGDIRIPPLVVSMVNVGAKLGVLLPKVRLTASCENRFEALAFAIAGKYVSEPVHFISVEIRNGQHR